MADERRPPLRLVIVGTGRVGLALGLALHRSGAARAPIFIGRRPEPPRHPLFTASPPARYLTSPALLAEAPGAVLIAVPDDRIGLVAAELAAAGLPRATPALHTSGAVGTGALDALARAGHPTGSLHPLAAVAEGPEGADRLVGAWYAVEGDPAAVQVGRAIVASLEGRLLQLPDGAKVRYHAAAVTASNHVTVLLGAAERILVEAGVPEGAARAALADLARGAVDNYAARGAAAALTGPVSRGDAATVARHLAELSPPERPLYSVLARGALELGRQRGLDRGAIARLEEALEEEQ